MEHQSYTVSQLPNAVFDSVQPIKDNDDVTNNTV